MVLNSIWKWWFSTGAKNPGQQFFHSIQNPFVDLENKLIGFRKYGAQAPVPFEGTQGGPYVITVREGKVLFMRRDRTVQDAPTFTKQDVEAMIARGNWGILENHHPVTKKRVFSPIVEAFEKALKYKKSNQGFPQVTPV